MERSLTLSFWRSVAFRWRGALCWERGAAMAFFALFSVAPLFVLMLSVLDRLFGIGLIRGELYTLLVRVLGTGTADAVRALILQPSLFRGGIGSVIANMLFTAVGSAALFRHMQRCLAVVWRADEGDGRGPAHFLGSFFRSFFAMGALTVFVVGGLFVFACAVLIGPLAKSLLFGAGTPTFWPAATALLTLFGVTGIFAVLYETLAPQRPSARRLGVASALVFVALLFAKAAVGSFADTHTLLSLFGAGSAVVYLLLWCFFLAQVFLFAAVVAAVRTEE